MKKTVIYIVTTAVLSSALTLGAVNIYNRFFSLKIVKGDGGCPLSVLSEAQKNGQIYDVLSPVGESSIKQISQAPRLDTLDGKTIALVGGSFMANVTHPEIKRLILEHYPSAKVIMLNEIGSAGPYPGPGIKRQQKEDFEQKLKEMKVDAVISGNGGCGLCTPKEEGSCITAEYIGIPSVMITAPNFAAQAKSAALTAGVPVQRVAIYPGAFSSHTREELVKNTREVLWQQIVDGLTKPITQEEKDEATESLQNSSNSTAFSGTFDEVQEYFEANGMTDGLPVIPPTEDVVNEFYKYTPYSKDTLIGNIPPSYRNVTVKEIAVTGAMAGCPPEYMPILIAYTKAMTDGDFRRTLASTHAWTPFIWLNGPLARQLGIDAGQGEISSPKNKKIGRFIDLAMINFGGYEIKKNRMGTFGYLSSWCMAEDEEALSRIGWQPYHVQQGFNVNDNTITAASSLNWGNNLTPATSEAERISDLMALDAVEKEQFALGAGKPFVYRTIFITEFVARDLADKYKDKESLEAALIQKARRPLNERVYAAYFANPGSSFEGRNYSFEQYKAEIAKNENAQLTSVPVWKSHIGTNLIETVPVMQEGKTAIIVTGDADRNKVLTVPGGGMTTIKIELPDNWDELTEKAGYKPLSDYYIKDFHYIENIKQDEEQNDFDEEKSTKHEQKALSNERIMNLSTQARSERNKIPSPEKYRQIRAQRGLPNKDKSTN